MRRLLRPSRDAALAVLVAGALLSLVPLAGTDRPPDLGSLPALAAPRRQAPTVESVEARPAADAPRPVPVQSRPPGRGAANRPRVPDRSEEPTDPARTAILERLEISDGPGAYDRLLLEAEVCDDPDLRRAILEALVRRPREGALHEFRDLLAQGRTDELRWAGVEVLEAFLRDARSHRLEASEALELFALHRQIRGELERAR